MSAKRVVGASLALLFVVLAVLVVLGALWLRGAGDAGDARAVRPAPAEGPDGGERAPATDAEAAEPETGGEREPGALGDRDGDVGGEGEPRTSVLRLRGRVSVPDGTPAGERVEVVARAPSGAIVARAAADPAGRFALELGPEISSAQLDLRAPHLFLRQPRFVRASRPPRGPLELVASLGGRLAVAYAAVPGAAEEPPDDLELRVEGAGTPRTARAEARVVRIDALPPGAVRVAVVGDAWHVARHDPLPVVPGETTRLELELARLARVTGTVTDAAGVGVAGATVFAPDWPRPGGGQTRSADDGSFTLAVPAPAARLVATSAAHGSTEARVEDLRPGEPRDGVRLSFAGGATLRGRVELPDGSPARAELVLSRGAEDGGRERVRELTTAADGSFRVEALAAGRYDLFARELEVGAALPRTATAALEADGEGIEHRVVLSDGEALGLLVRDDVDRALRRFEVELVRLPEGTVYRGASLGRGELELAPVSPGRYEVRVRAKGHSPERLAFDHPSPTTRSGLVLRLQRLARVAGRVLRPDGLPAEGARVRLAGEVATCDALGRFRFEGVAPGDAPLRATADGFEDGPERELDLAAGEVREDVELRLGPAR